MRDPIAQLRRSLRRQTPAGLAVLVGVAVWTFWPQPPVVPRRLALSAPASLQRPERPALDEASFDVTLWTAPRKPQPEMAAQAPRDPAPRLELIGIVRDEGILRAAIYDPATDQLHVVRDGDVIDRCTVTVAEESVEITSGSSRWTLRIREEPS